MKQIVFFLVWTKKYPLIIEDTKDKEVIYIKCEWAELDQRYARADLPFLFQDLPDMIKDIQKEKKEDSLLIRLSWKDKLKIEELTAKNWFKSVSSYIRAKALQSA
jgi:hypothetical protein